MRKISLSVNNPQDPLEERVQEVCHAVTGIWLDDVKIKGLIEALVGYDGLFEEFLSRPDQILTELLGHKEDNSLLCIPCYTLELRQILRTQKIISPYRIAAFGTLFAKRNLLDYPVLLVINASKLPDQSVMDLNGVSVYGEQLHLNGSLLRVLCRERVDSESAHETERIVMDEYPSASVHVITEVPGLQVPKLAQLMPQAPIPQLKKYLVNATIFGIENDILKSTSPKAALDDALTKAWRKTGNPHRDPKYTADFWEQQGMLPVMVEEYHGQPTDKTAQMKEKYTIWLNCDRKPSNHLLPFSVCSYPDGKTFNGTVSSSYSNSSFFTSIEKAQQWLNKSAPNFDFFVGGYDIISITDFDKNGSTAYSYPFNWKALT